MCRKVQSKEDSSVPVNRVAGSPLAPGLPSGGEMGALTFPGPDVQRKPGVHLMAVCSSSEVLPSSGDQALLASNRTL